MSLSSDLFQELKRRSGFVAIHVGLAENDAFELLILREGFNDTFTVTFLSTELITWSNYEFQAF